jgi:hypothetical protein
LVWFEAASNVLNTAIKTRNQVLSEYFNHQANEFHLILKKARKNIKRKAEQALTDWTFHIEPTVNGKESFDDNKPLTPKDISAAVRELSDGPKTAMYLKPLRLWNYQQPGGTSTLCSNPDENTQVIDEIPKTSSQHVELSMSTRCTACT